MKSTLFEENISAITLEENKESFDTFLSPTSMNLRSAMQSSNHSHYQTYYIRPPPSLQENVCSTFMRIDERPDPKTVNSPVPVTPTLSEQNMPEQPYLANSKHVSNLHRTHLPVKDSVKSLQDIWYHLQEADDSHSTFS